MFDKCKLKKKIKALEKKVKMDDLQSMYDLAMIYLDGSVIKVDTNKAYSLLKQAADAGHIQSKTYLISKKISDSVSIGAKAVSDIKTLLEK